MKSPRNIRKIASEVYYATTGFSSVGPEAVMFLKNVAGGTQRKRARICFHPDPSAPAHEMLIAMHCSNYVQPHRHVTRPETLIALEGKANALLFDEVGAVTNRLTMGSYESKCTFFYRMPAGIFHTIHFETEWFIYLETTLGPFNPADTEVASWAPEEADADAGRCYLASLL